MVMISLPVREVWGSITVLVKSDAESPTARHRCDIFSEFEAVSPRHLGAEMGPATHYMLGRNTGSIMKV